LGELLGNPENSTYDNGAGNGKRERLRKVEIGQSAAKRL